MPHAGKSIYYFFLYFFSHQSSAFTVYPKIALYVPALPKYMHRKSPGIVSFPMQDFFCIYKNIINVSRNYLFINNFI